MTVNPLMKFIIIIYHENDVGQRRIQRGDYEVQPLSPLKL